MVLVRTIRPFLLMPSKRHGRKIAEQQQQKYVFTNSVFFTGHFYVLLTAIKSMPFFYRLNAYFLYMRSSSAHQKMVFRYTFLLIDYKDKMFEFFVYFLYLFYKKYLGRV